MQAKLGRPKTAALSMSRPGRGGKQIRVAPLLVAFAFLSVFTGQLGRAEAAFPPASSSSSQGSTNQADDKTDKNSPEMASHDVTPTFKVNVKLILVRVVVRDNQGHAVGNLRQEDFQVFDNRKPQVISQFSVEQPGTRAAPEMKSTEEASGSDQVGIKNPPPTPELFTAYLFDDVHLKFGDLSLAREAAARRLAALNPSDRVAIFSTSGKTALDFTDDREKLNNTLLALRSRPMAADQSSPCPDVSYYTGDLIENKHDQQALQAVTLDALHCAFDDNQQMMQAAQNMAEAAARQSIAEGESESRLALGVLKDVVRRISLVPGQRNIVLVSPGFQTPQLEYEYNDIIERALHSETIISALDARGLYVPGPAGDISKQLSGNVLVAGQETLYDIDRASTDADVLAVLADGTGGTFFHNNNDLNEGLKRIAAAPEYSYVLGFSPQNLKLDGSFHALKVTLRSPLKLSLQARRGYFAPKHLADPSEQAKHEIEDALFSQEEIHGLPVEMRTRFFKSGDDNAKLSVLARVDIKHIRFRKEDGRNRNELTVVSALFDRNGNYLKGEEQILQMRLKDETLESKLGSGITLKASFDVKPGTYVVRLIVRDAEGQSIAAENGAVEIP
jgi:VWFA-related protein